MSQDHLGEFEQMVLLSILRLDDDAYGLAIIGELEKVADRVPATGAIYTTLDRLERKGLIESYAGDATGERGGRPRRYVRVTSEGRTHLARSRHTLMALWRGLEGVLDR